MKIKILSTSTINRIAAGEVIERPASVIKELIENSIDAGSDRIDVVLERSGKNLIIISDNGYGLSCDDLEIAVERHTTSKLDEDDLLNIQTFGFRGEALPAIGAISKLLITSKCREDTQAYQLQLAGGHHKQITPAIYHQGTKIEVRDLFFATPARLKFLRSDKVEFTAILDIVKKITLAHPYISFSLSHEGKMLIKVRSQSGDLATALRQRATEIIGQAFIENSALVSLSSPELSIIGYVGLPTFNRATASDQFLFVNNRPIKDKILNIALKVAYQDYLARDRYPAAVLFLKIDPQLVDVNVHPAKNEVRFNDPNTVRNLLIRAIKDALLSSSHKTSTHIAAAALSFLSPGHNNLSPKQALQTSFARPVSSIGLGGSSVAKAPELPVSNNATRAPSALPAYQSQLDFISSPLAAEILEETPEKTAHDYLTYRLGAAKTQLHQTYIVSQTTDSIIITDQHAAHERLGYEKIKQIISKNGLIKQRLLIPEIIELPDVKRAEILADCQADLSNFGLTLEKFGDKSIIVSEVPSILGDVNIQQLIQDLADHLASSSEKLSLVALISHVTETYACYYSIRAGRRLSLPEMNELLRQMEQTPFSGQCNHGRPTYVELKLVDIEKLFGRR